MEERRLLLAVALSLLVLTAYSLLFAPTPPPAAAVGPTPLPTALAAGPASRRAACSVVIHSMPGASTRSRSFRPARML